MSDSTPQPTESATDTVDLERTVQREGETFSLFGLHRDSFSERYHLTRRGKVKRLNQIIHIARQFDIFHGLTPVKMRLMFEALGPTFVKVGQILSMRSEMLPQSFCDELSKLRADADPMPYQVVIDTLAEALAGQGGRETVPRCADHRFQGCGRGTVGHLRSGDRFAGRGA